MFKTNTTQKVHYTLRIASALCFMGHGIFGVITRPVWCNYFAVFGIDHALSYQLMPVLGYVDIFFGLLILFYPVRAVVFWLVIWGFITALLRPLSGEPFPEFLERFGNFGAPLALLIISGGMKGNIKNWLSPIKTKRSITKKQLSELMIVLRLVIFFLLLGHGLLNVMGKKNLLDEYSMLGFIAPAETAMMIGLFEIVAAITVFIRPLRQLILLLFLWKMTSELFYPKYEIFEWIERSGSYGSILALWFALDLISVHEIKSIPFKIYNYAQSVSLTFKNRS